MNQLQIFRNEEFGQVRMVEKDGKPYAVGVDVARVLEYVNPSKAVLDHCKGISKLGIPSQGGTQETNVIPEGDIYRLIVKAADQSRNLEIKAKAERFERWIFDEVIPSIRKHGGYLTPEKIEEALLDPDTIIRLATDLKNERKKRIELENKAKEDKPKVLFADAVSVAPNSILIGDLAKLIRQNGIDIGRDRLFEWMRNNGYLIKQQGQSYNMPTQKGMDLGLFQVKERAITNPDGSIRIAITPKVTGKGQLYFVNKFVQQKAR